MMAAEGEIQVYVCDTLGQRGNVATSTEGKRRIGEGVVGHNRRHYSELRTVWLVAGTGVAHQADRYPSRDPTVYVVLSISLWRDGGSSSQSRNEVCLLTVAGNRSQCGTMSLDTENLGMGDVAQETGSGQSDVDNILE